MVPLSTTGFHVGKHQLEAIAQGLHIWIWVLLQLKALGDHLHRPVLQSRVLAGLETKVEVTGVFGVDAEGIGRATRVGLSIGLKPLVCQGG